MIKGVRASAALLKLLTPDEYGHHIVDVLSLERVVRCTVWLD